MLEKMEKRLLDLTLERFELEAKLERTNSAIRKYAYEMRRQQRMLEQAKKQGEKQVKKLGKEKEA